MAKGMRGITVSMPDTRDDSSAGIRSRTVCDACEQAHGLPWYWDADTEHQLPWGEIEHCEHPLHGRSLDEVAAERARREF